MFHKDIDKTSNPSLGSHLSVAGQVYPSAFCIFHLKNNIIFRTISRLLSSLCIRSFYSTMAKKKNIVILKSINDLIGLASE